jgi:hypothetical protein
MLAHLALDVEVRGTVAREADYVWCDFNPGPANTMELHSTSGAHHPQLDDVGLGSQHVGCRGAGAGSKEAAGGRAVGSGAR